jgi:solute carrier family 26 (sodium-independent sulfate anion transporter), member 11
MAPNALGRFLAKIFFIDLDYRKEPSEPLTGSGALSVSSVETYVEKEPSSKDWLYEHRPTAQGAKSYIKSLFPFWNWIFHYNLTWLLGDIIAGMSNSTCAFAERPP